MQCTHMRTLTFATTWCCTCHVWKLLLISPVLPLPAALAIGALAEQQIAKAIACVTYPERLMQVLVTKFLALHKNGHIQVAGFSTECI